MARKSGENVGNEDAYLEPTSLTQSGREAGAWIYIDAHTLKTALREAGIPEDTPVGGLQAVRHVLRKGGKGVAQVLLKVTLRAVTTDVDTRVCPSCGEAVPVNDRLATKRLVEHKRTQLGGRRTCEGSGAEVA